MNLHGSTILILGGSGLVGRAVGRRLLASAPQRLVLVSLTERDSAAALAALAPGAGGTAVVSEHGNIYLPASLSHTDRAALLDDPGHRAALLEDLFDELSEAILARSFLFQLLQRHRPDVVVDCVNTATAFAYQDAFASARALRQSSADGRADLALVERHLLSEPMPQLIRHTQVAIEGMRRAGTRAYVKIGTSGTGGMGFNIPYTHSEERPSRALMTKSAMAGAQTLLLYLLGRTPGAPATVEIKPTAAIGWQAVEHGTVLRAGLPIPLVDCPEPLPIEVAFSAGASGWRDLGRPLTSAYVNMGENGLFAAEEFATITALGQMEFITPEEIAEHVAMELEGRPTGRDVVAALDGATAGPTYRAGILREAALRRLAALEAEHGIRSIAFEMLGPPRLTKVLYEAHLWSRLCPSVAALASADPDRLGRDAQALLDAEPALRSEILSVGIPVLRPDGRSVHRGPTVAVPPAPGDALAAAPRGWVDLRPANCARWVARAREVVRQAADRAALGGGSGSDRDWFAVEPAEPVIPWRMATWIFRHEDAGERIKR